MYDTVGEWGSYDLMIASRLDQDCCWYHWREHVRLRVLRTSPPCALRKQKATVAATTSFCIASKMMLPKVTDLQANRKKVRFPLLPTTEY